MRIYTIEGVEFDVVYEVDGVNDRDTTQKYLVSVKHNGFEFIELLDKKWLDLITEDLNWDDDD